MIFNHTVVETFHVVSCYTCGVRFGIETDLHRRVVTDAKGAVYCPACGKETCWRESEDQKRIKQLEQKLEWEAKESAKLKEAWNQSEASLRTTKGVVTKLRNRVGHGVCPCCKRTFKQLSAHMKQQHPDWNEKPS